MTDTDLIGEVFEDKDWRSDGRRVRVISTDSPTGTANPYYVVEVIAYDRQPSVVGHRSKVRLSTLHKRYRKVSH